MKKIILILMIMSMTLQANWIAEVEDVCLDLDKFQSKKIKNFTQAEAYLHGIVTPLGLAKGLAMGIETAENPREIAKQANELVLKEVCRTALIDRTAPLMYQRLPIVVALMS